MENSSPVDEKIRDLIHEYLMKRGMLKSVDSIIEEWGKWANMSTMRRGKDSSFAELFLLEVKNQELINKELQEFKKYFETTGKEISADPEIVPYFALPFVPKPKEHPIFAKLYTKEWVEATKKKLTKVLHHFLPRNGPAVLTNLVQNSTDQSKLPPRNEEIEELKSKISEQNEKYNELLQKDMSVKSFLLQSQNKWTSFANDIVKVCYNLLGIIDSQANNKQVDGSHIKELKEKVEKYNQFITQYVKDMKEFPEQEEFKEVSMPEEYKQPHIKKEPVIDDGKSLVPLNYSKISEFLRTTNDQMKICALMQALRWRITRSKHGIPRKHVLHSYTSNDLLGCQNNEDVLISILSKSERKVVEYTMCLLNVFASEMLGTDYLHKNSKLIAKLTEILYKENEDSNLRQNTLGSLQKLSLRRDPQTTMIKLNLISWIINLLQKENDTISEYTLEYATALLMNLALRTAGKQKCVEQKEQVMKVLDELLETENMQVRTYINGTLYSILTMPALKEQAKSIGLDKRLEVMYEENQSEDRLKNQIEYILAQLKNDEEVECLSDDKEDLQENEEDEDYETEDEDEVDNEICKNNIPIGESLLLQEFTNPSTEAKLQSDQIMNNLLKEPVIPKTTTIDTVDVIPLAQRPKTPHLSTTKIAQIPKNNAPIPPEMEAKPKIPIDEPKEEEEKQVPVKEPEIPPIEANIVQPPPEPEQPVLNENEYKENIKQIIDGSPNLTKTKEKFFVFQSRPKLVRSPKNGSGHSNANKSSEISKFENVKPELPRPPKKKVK